MSSRLTARVMQFPQRPCPGPPAHDCTDQHHPLRVDVFYLEPGGDPIAIPMTPGTGSVAVALLDDSDPESRPIW